MSGKGSEPAGGGVRASPPAIPDTLLPIIERLIRGETRSAEILLRELLAADEAHLAHKHCRQIERVESYFGQINRCRAWPSDMEPGHITYWRGKLGGILAELPLPKALEDIKANPGKRSLIFFLSTDRGSKASRWEMLLVAHREERWEAQKAQEASDAQRFFGQSVPGNVREEQWITDLKQERKRLLLLATDANAPADKRDEAKQRLARIEAVFRAKGVRV